jgi:CheY-like chemotaxis protein
MSTLLLVSGETTSEKPGTGQPGQRRAPSMRGALERAGYEVVEVGDAASVFQRLGDRPDLIVVSGILPDMDLLDLCVALRKDPIAEKVPFVLVADAAARTGGAAARTGADLVFPTTVGPAEIADRLRRLF